jgi:hypothetical protein
MRVNDWADRILRGLTEAKQALAAAKERQKKYADVRRRPLTLTPGQKARPHRHKSWKESFILPLTESSMNAW